ncbi:hypothetical protein SE17_02595 [Kouleothrix aurantiaca]|uniref:Nbr1 FW domain-containing protein n=1 Tax=Kouleothrix aurantiaca TaxID=186479 RepID=A0A0P9FMZ6_9CHLR|nr:hypothetical protein SE17_02595 [Kouleothrix aurantiaca]
MWAEEKLLHAGHGKWAFSRWRSAVTFLILFVLLPLSVLWLLHFAPLAHAAPVEAIRYATGHWNWSSYDESKNTVSSGTFQPNFQCAEFVARSIAAAGSIGDLKVDSTSDQLGSLLYNGKRYNVRMVTGLYNFLIDTGIGKDVGTDKQSATLGSVVIYGNFEHTAIVTNVTDPSQIKVTAHNTALLDYAIDGFYRSYPDDPMSITHIVLVNYNKVSSGARLPVSTPPKLPSPLLAPAPYNGSIVTSGINLSWRSVGGAKGYEVAIYNVWGQPVAGISTINTSFSFPLQSLPYGVYNYTIQPVSDMASFVTYEDTFNYEPESCLLTPSALECGGASGVGAVPQRNPSLGMLLITQPDIPVLKPGEVKQISFTVQNTGRLIWPEGSVKLINVNGQTLQATPPQLPAIAAGALVTWQFSIKAPQQPGAYDSIWQLAFYGQPFGERIHIAAVVLPEGSDADLGQMIQGMIDDARQKLNQKFEETWEGIKRDIERRIQEEIQRQVERQIRSICGVAPTAIVIASGIVWWRRRRRGEWL